MGGMDVIRWPVPGESGAHWQARAFGQCLTDLEVDVRAAPPQVTTAIVRACLSQDGEAFSEQAIWDWTVNRRLQALLAVTVATRGARWTHTAICGHTTCGAAMDLPLSLQDFQRQQDPLTVSCTLDDGHVLTVPVPRGRDQLAWLQQGSSNTTHMLASLLPTAEQVSETTGVIVEDALTEADPLTALILHTACPECGGDNQLPLDLEALCLSLLAQEGPRLLDQIHRLALAYHWSEAEILAISPARRREYLARLEEAWA
jgi:hypothetical protein